MNPTIDPTTNPAIVDMALDIMAAQLYERRKDVSQHLPCEPAKATNPRGAAMWACPHLENYMREGAHGLVPDDRCIMPEYVKQAQERTFDENGNTTTVFPGHECWKAYATSQAHAAGGAGEAALDLLASLLWDMLRSEMWLPCNVAKDPVGAGLPWHCPHLEFEHSAFCTIGSKCRNPEHARGEDLADAVGEAYEFPGAACWKSFALAAAGKALEPAKEAVGGGEVTCRA
jgi:hypothetical protein